MRSLFLYLLFVLSACGGQLHHPEQPVVVAGPEFALRTRYLLYRDLAAPLRDSHGWAYPKDCDGLLFSALQGVAEDREFDIEAARDPDGAWHRRPLEYGPCYQSGSGEGGEISRDMFQGLFIYCLHFQRLDILEGVWTYGYIHNWQMGIGDSRTVLTPAGIGRLARIIRHLGGVSHPDYLTPDIYSATPGFPAHLTLLSIDMEGGMRGALTETELSTVREIMMQDPYNPLAQALFHKYTDGDQGEAIRLLLTVWPETRLPTTSDWCEAWRIQRDITDSSLQPCQRDTPETHTGGDLLFVAQLILGVISR